jgi:hypothetical protein
MLHKYLPIVREVAAGLASVTIPGEPVLATADAGAAMLRTRTKEKDDDLRQ